MRRKNPASARAWLISVFLLNGTPFFCSHSKANPFKQYVLPQSVQYNLQITNNGMVYCIICSEAFLFSCFFSKFLLIALASALILLQVSLLNRWGSLARWPMPDAALRRYCALSAIEMRCIILRYINFLFYSILF